MDNTCYRLLLTSENNIILRCIGDDASMKSCYKHVSDRGMIPLNVTGKLALYSAVNTLNRDSVKKFLSHYTTNNVFSLRNIPDTILHSFLDSDLFHGYLIRRGLVDYDRTKFYVTDDLVRAVTYFRKYPSGDLALLSTYFDDITQVLPPLICSLLIDLSQTDGDPYVLVPTSNPKSWYIFRKLFGEPERLYNVHEYGYHCEDHEKAEQIYNKSLKTLAEKHSEDNDLRCDKALSYYLDEEESSICSGIAYCRSKFIPKISSLPAIELAEYTDELRYFFKENHFNNIESLVNNIMNN